MQHNVGSVDKLLRISAGVILLGLTVTNVIGWWGVIGVVPLLTGLVNWCPAESLLGIRSCKVKS
jgi:hypothetical protein